MIYTYLLKSLKDNSFYCGITRDVNNRLIAHNRGGLKSTADKRPWKLIYYREHNSYDKARKNEKWLKKKNREYKENLACLACDRRGELAPPCLGGVK